MRMESGTEYIFHVFWEDSIWLPPNTTWKVKDRGRWINTMKVSVLKINWTDKICNITILTRLFVTSGGC